MPRRRSLRDLQLDLISRLQERTAEALTLYQSRKREEASQVLGQVQTLYLENESFLEHIQDEVFTWNWREGPPLRRYLFQSDPFSDGGIWKVPQIIETLREELTEATDIDAPPTSQLAEHTTGLPTAKPLPISEGECHAEQIAHEAVQDPRLVTKDGRPRLTPRRILQSLPQKTLENVQGLTYGTVRDLSGPLQEAGLMKQDEKGHWQRTPKGDLWLA